MITKIRQFIARIVDTRVSEAVVDIHRSLQHIESNAVDRHKEIETALQRIFDRLDAQWVACESETVVKIRQAVSDAFTGVNMAQVLDVMKTVNKKLETPTPRALPPVPPVPKKTFVGAELKNEKIKNSKEWSSLSDPFRALFVSQVKNEFDDIEVQGFYEAEVWNTYAPAAKMLDDCRARALSRVREEFF